MSYVTVRITATNRCAVAGVACGHEPHHPYLVAAILLLAISTLVLATAVFVRRRT
jgi:hypothetical protein